MTAVRLATEDDLPWVKAMADRHRVEVGFVMRHVLAMAVARRELLVLDTRDGFCHYHRRRDGWATVYEVVSERRGGGRALLGNVPVPFRLKCLVDNERANGFYARVGGTIARTETGKRRALNVWEWRAWWP